MSEQIGTLVYPVDEINNLLEKTAAFDIATWLGYKFEGGKAWSADNEGDEIKIYDAPSHSYVKIPVRAGMSFSIDVDSEMTVVYKSWCTVDKDGKVIKIGDDISANNPVTIGIEDEQEAYLYINNYTNRGYKPRVLLYYSAGEIISWLSNKVDKVEGKGLSTNDYTNEEKAQVQRVRNGSVVVENTLSALDETSDNPVSSAAVSRAISNVTDKTASIENEYINDKDDGIIIENNDGVQVINITASVETVYKSEQRWESDDGAEVFAKINEDGIDGKVSRIIPSITIPIVVEPDSDIVDEGYASPIGRGNVIRANWSAENKYTYYDFIAHYYDIYIGESDGYSVSKRSLGNDASNSGYELFEYDFCPLNYKKVVMISAGMNTCETGALWGLATFIKAMMTSDEEGFKFLRENVRFKTIPMICPSSFDKDTLAYPNSNGVRINKNFDYCRNWYDITNSQKGDYPDSEVESRILKKWLNDNAWEADLYIDCHQDPDKNISQEKVLTVVICSDSATNRKLRECFPALVQFYRDKGYIAPDISPDTQSWVETGTNYPKTKYAKEICGIPSIMIEQYCSSTMYGSDGNTINDVVGIKNYVTMLRLYIFAILAGVKKVINCGNISRLTK